MSYSGPINCDVDYAYHYTNTSLGFYHCCHHHKVGGQTVTYLSPLSPVSHGSLAIPHKWIRLRGHQLTKATTSPPTRSMAVRKLMTQYSAPVLPMLFWDTYCCWHNLTSLPDTRGSEAETNRNSCSNSRLRFAHPQHKPRHTRARSSHGTSAHVHGRQHRV